MAKSHCENRIWRMAETAAWRKSIEKYQAGEIGARETADKSAPAQNGRPAGAAAAAGISSIEEISAQAKAGIGGRHQHRKKIKKRKREKENGICVNSETA